VVRGGGFDYTPKKIVLFVKIPNMVAQNLEDINLNHIRKRTTGLFDYPK